MGAARREFAAIQENDSAQSRLMTDLNHTSNLLFFYLNLAITSSYLQRMLQCSTRWLKLPWPPSSSSVHFVLCPCPPPPWLSTPTSCELAQSNPLSVKLTPSFSSHSTQLFLLTPLFMCLCYCLLSQLVLVSS